MLNFRKRIGWTYLKKKQDPFCSISYFKKNKYISPGNSVGPHTILNGIKKDDVILGISRIKDFLHALNQGGILKSTQNKKYYLIVEKIEIR